MPMSARIDTDAIIPAIQKIARQHIIDLIEFHASRSSEHLALLCPERAPTTYASLHEKVLGIALALKTLGIVPDDCVAVDLPGPAVHAILAREGSIRVVSEKLRACLKRTQKKSEIAHLLPKPT